ncbi:PTS fructose transporter subunit IIB [Clostridioides difficile]|nr:fructose-like phosphotransferase enzyme IIB component 1 [Clostridioides difficile CD38]EQE84134.1 fructose-like phosphotransferase enzyme IIB component 1 [Clostridioides difficile CD69]EQH04845.1 fructose-like phosphotransferase enzyme IIB component 1 [Clostridioides difficile DA00195]EQH55580.1 fructose-like phosphotransferase enzyme IIB component 1 [Clostridioides difficile DA00261]EQH60771.1 fructose-like phosphotransferase enzyme IIB component 1 [Clostridioides difficile DA00275]EQI3402
MAAEAIEQAAKALGYEAKVETQGADGVQNELTRDDILGATMIIHAVAITPEGMERFDGCEVYEVELQEAIKNAEGVIKEIEEDLGI